jgi:glutamate N-acetyltransferase / amino-acid N-acetyltransferase
MTQHTVTLVEGNATTPGGFRANGLRCGIRVENKDLALLWCDARATAAGLFTTNQVKAAPVIVCQEQLVDGEARGIVVNSGNANACTGEQGLKDAHEMVRLTAQAMGVRESDILVCSTGLIGRVLPMDALRGGIPKLPTGLSREGGQLAAEAIMTTDAFVKTQAATVLVDGAKFSIGGMAKGAGMIHPRLATTLGFLTTDVRVTPDLLKKALQQAMATSFNSITVDGDTSTNDAVLVLASGRSGVQVSEGPVFEAFVDGLTQVAQELAKMVVRDGEGARRLVELTVRGGKSYQEAKQVAETIAGSLLFKTMLVGGEPNWGRVIAAAGRSGVSIQPDALNLWFGGIQVVKNGLGLEQNLSRAAQVLQGREVEIVLDLCDGPSEATVWTCDINENYVVLNGSYMT